MPAIGISSSISSSSSFSASDSASTSFPSSMQQQQQQPSTIKSSENEDGAFTTTTTTTTTALPILRHRHHRVRPPPPPPAASSISDLIHDQNDTVLIPPTNYRKPQIDNSNDKMKNTFAGGIFGNRTSQPAGQSLASVFLLIFVLIGIVMILMLFYFLAKVCNGPDEERKGKLKTKNGKIIIQHPDRKNEKIEIIPTKVPYPKRIYELQAEEGYYSCPPSIHQSLQDIFGDNEDDFFGHHNNGTNNSQTAQRSRSMDDNDIPESKKESQSTPPSTQFVRKLTGAGLPPNFKPKGRLQQLQGGS